MKRERLDEILARIRTVNVAVLGDFCLDAYWLVDRTFSQPSVETGKSTVPVRVQKYSLGGAGNIVANLVDLGVANVFAVGVIGPDIFGDEMVRQLTALKADSSGMITQSGDWSTPVYGKLYAGNEEEPRIDFGVYNVLAGQTEDAFEAALRSILPKMNAVILNQQLPHGIGSDRMIEKLNHLVAEHPDCTFIVDSRERSEKYQRVIYRFNAHEAARLCGISQPLDQGVLLENAMQFAEKICAESGKPVFISRGNRGSIVRWDGQTEIVPGIQSLKKTDPVGAGDTSVSAIAAALAAGASPYEAAVLANFASAVTVQKIRTTGTATPDEIRKIGYDPDYVYRPELAGDPRAARYLDDSEIEVVTNDWPRGKIRHALFDHDGTISTLRQGWEPIMEDVFIRTILGSSYDTADESLYRRVADRVREYITKSTGIQTLAQMATLADMVREFGFVQPDLILDAHGYKRIYLKGLMETVNQRTAKLGRGELDVNDVTIKGAIAFLKLLRKRGVRLYLASGTDDADVKREAAALGYADLFDGGIYGATADAAYDAKRQVVEHILASKKLSGAELVCFGDGPVELREGKKRGGIAVGIASDEVRRYGLSAGKRARLICAGADMIVPDFTQATRLAEYLLTGAG